MRKIALKYFVLFLFFVISLLSGCYTYNNISIDEYFKKEKHNKTQIVLKNENKIFIDNPDSIKISSDISKIIVFDDTTKTVILISDIFLVKEKKYNNVLSFFTILGIGIISILLCYGYIIQLPD